MAEGTGREAVARADAATGIEPAVWTTVWKEAGAEGVTE